MTFDPADCAQTDDVLSRCLAISIGVLYTEADMDDIIHAVRKVDENIG